jgi:hypothetical protein
LEEDAMSDAERENKLLRIWGVFGDAVQKAEVRVLAGVGVDFPKGSDSAVVTVTLDGQGRRFNLNFSVDASGNILAVTAEDIIVGTSNLYDDRVVDMISSAIKNAATKEFG